MRIFCKWFFKKSSSTWTKFSCYFIMHIKENKFCIRSLRCRLHIQAWKFIVCWRKQEVYLCYFSFLTGEKFYTNSLSCWQLSLLLHIETMFPQNDSVGSQKVLWDVIDNTVIPQKLRSVIFHACDQFSTKTLLCTFFNIFYDLLLLMHLVSLDVLSTLKYEWLGLKICHPELFSMLNTCRLQCRRIIE